MRTFLFGIFICVAFIFELSGIKGETLQETGTVISAMEQNTIPANRDNLSAPGITNEAIATNGFSFDVFSLRIFDVPTSASSLTRGTSFPKNLKSISTIQILSSLSTPLFARNSKDLYVQYSFVKSSCKYFVYTLRRLLI